MRATLVAVLILTGAALLGVGLLDATHAGPPSPEAAATTRDGVPPQDVLIRRAEQGSAYRPSTGSTSPTSGRERTRSSDPADPPAERTLRCTVLAAANRRPIGDLEVGLFAQGADVPVDRGRTDAAGSVVLHAPRAGNYLPLPIDPPEVWGQLFRGRFADPENPPAAHAPPRRLPAGDGKPVEVVLELSQAAVVSGMVTGRDRPLAGATVRVQTAFDLSGVETVTDAAGRFRLERLPAGAFWLVCVPHGAGFEAPPSREIELAAGTRLDVGRIECPPTPRGALRGVLVNRAGTPCAGLELLCLDDPAGDDRSGRWVHTADDGRFEFTGLTAGTKRLVIQERPTDLLDHLPPLDERLIDVADRPIELGRIVVERR